MRFRTAIKLHNEDEVLLKAGGGLKHVIAAPGNTRGGETVPNVVTVSRIYVEENKDGHPICWIVDTWGNHRMHTEFF